MSVDFTFNAKVNGIVKGYEYAQFKRIRICSKEKFPCSRYVEKHKTYFGSIAGVDLPLEKGLNITFNATIAKGKYLNCTSWEYAKPTNKTQVEKYLWKKLKGTIKKVKLKELIQVHGLNTIALFEDNKKDELSPFFTNEEKMEKAIFIIQHSDDEGKFIKYMLKEGVTNKVAQKIYREFGEEAFNIVQTNPYKLVRIKGVGFKTCENIARTLGLAMDSEERILEGTTYILDRTLSMTGDLYMSVEELGTKVAQELGSITPEAWNRVINENTNHKGTKRFSVYDGKIMLQTDADYELNTTRNIVNLSGEDVPYETSELDTVIEQVISANPFRMSERQIEAVRNSLAHRVSVITGGPGTGKTSIVTAIIKSWKKLTNLPVVCLAPTGKAASRMSEVTGVGANTIHSALNLIPEVEAEEIRILPQGLIIVDESSMIDQFTCSSLLKATVRGSSVIFVGDIFQLPSVGRGDVLNQMIESKTIYITKLIETFRQGKDSLIINNAKKINEGNTNLEYGDDFKFYNLTDDDLEEFKKIYTEAVEKYGADQVAVLCPRRRTNEAGTLNMVSDKINIIIQEILNPLKDGMKTAKVMAAGGINTTFRINDRVMSWKNTKEVSNGDIGIISDIFNFENETLFKIEWENESISTFTVEDMENVSLAYSMSIHKSQGSEYSCVIMPFIKSHNCPLFQRNLLYTGVTRAKKECILLGDKESIDYCIEHEVTGTRKSFLGKRLEKAKSLF